MNAEAPASLPAARAWPAAAVVERPIGNLKPYEMNSRTHSDEQVRHLAGLIERFGFTSPILIDEQDRIIAGHGRLAALQLLGRTVAPCMVATGWTEAERRAFIIADNQSALMAGWDMDKLAAEVQAIAGDFSVEALGFAEDFLAGLLNPGNGGRGDPEHVPAAPLVPVSRLGDTWLLGRHRIRCGDSTDAAAVGALLAGVKPHLMVTDPPYGVEYDAEWRAKAGVNTDGAATGRVLNDDRADWREAWALFPGDVAYIWHAGLFAGVVADSLAAAGFTLRSQIIWAKSSMVLSRGDYHWQHEPCWYAVRKGKNGHYGGGRKQTTIWSIEKPQKSETGHSTQKPVECMKRPIENNSSPGQAVYEPFSGSGTTLIAAEMTGRQCFAMELNPPYVDVAVRRWQEFTGETAVLEADGLTFAQVATARGPEAQA